MRFVIHFFALLPLFAEPKWVSLFNGKNLNGWHKNPARIGHGTGGSWTVQDGVIVGQQDPPASGNGGILLTDRKFGDFEVELQVKPDWGVDSGLFLRSTDTGKCYQVMIDYHEDGNVGEIYREGLDGKGNRAFSVKGIYKDPSHLVDLKSIAARRVPDNEPMIDLKNWGKIWKLNSWNTIRARVEGNPPTITSWINGTQITKYTSDQKFEGALGDTGSIALQVHGGKKAWREGARIRFRNIRVRELK